MNTNTESYFYSYVAEVIQFTSQKQAKEKVYSLDLSVILAGMCNSFNYIKCTLILTPQFFEVLHPFQYKASDILSTWMHTLWLTE